MKRSGNQLIIAIIVGVLFIVLSACSVEPTTADTSEMETPVRVEKVTQGDFTMNNEIIATTKPSLEVNIVPKIAGELTELHVEKGDSVEAGELLAVVDDQDLRRTSELEGMSRDLAYNQLESARLQMRQVEDSVKASLREESTVSNEAEDRVRQASLQVEQAEQSVRQSEVRLQQAEDRLQDSSIESLISGEVIQLSASLGETVGQSVLFTIVQLNPIQLEAEVSSNQLSTLQLGQQLEIEIPSVGLRTEGTIKFVSPAAEPSGLFHIELHAENPDKLIKSGMGARLFVPETLEKDALLVPTQAIIERGEISYVYIVREGKALLTEVEVLNSQTDLTAVRGDLQDQDSVIVKGQLTLTDGANVRIVEEDQ